MCLIQGSSWNYRLNYNKLMNGCLRLINSQMIQRRFQRRMKSQLIRLYCLKNKNCGNSISNHTQYKKNKKWIGCCQRGMKSQLMRLYCLKNKNGQNQGGKSISNHTQYKENKKWIGCCQRGMKPHLMRPYVLNKYNGNA
jgi:hypothetical protein